MKCPLKILLNKLGVNDETLKSVDTKIKGVVAEAAKFAQESPEPPASELFNDVTIN